MKKLLGLLCLLFVLAPCTSLGEGTPVPSPAAQVTPTAKPTKTPAKKPTKTPAKATKKATATPSPFLKKGETPVQTDTRYQSDSIAIQITARRFENTDVYVADIYVKSVRSFRRAYPGQKWGATAQRIVPFSQDQKAILSMTGDSSNNFSSGWAIMNGVTLRKTVNRTRDLAVLYTTGKMVTLLAGEIDYTALAREAEEGKIWQTFLFGPALLDERGKAKTTFNSKVGPVNPRSVIGYYAPGHYCFVQVDGRRTPSALEKGKKNAGLTLKNLSKLMESLGCKAAYNLDGGQSSLMYFHGKIHSTPYKNGRRLSDIVLIRELK